MTRQGIVWPRGNSPSRGAAPTSTPNQRPRISQPSMRTSIIGELIAARLPQVLTVYDPSHDSRLRSRAREPPRGDQGLGRNSQCRLLSVGAPRQDPAGRRRTRPALDQKQIGPRMGMPASVSRRSPDGAYRRRTARPVIERGMPPGPLGTLPVSGSAHRWFPAMVPGSPISVPKRSSNCANLMGAGGFEPPASRL